MRFTIPMRSVAMNTRSCCAPSTALRGTSTVIERSVQSRILTGCDRASVPSATEPSPGTKGSGGLTPGRGCAIPAIRSLPMIITL